MSSMDIRELNQKYQEYLGREVTISGWVRTSRDNGNFGFVEVNDGTCFKNLQIFADSKILPNYKDIAGASTGASLTATGIVQLSPGAKQAYELRAASAEILGQCAPDYPLQKKRHSVEFLRTIAHLRPRTNLYSAIFRVRSVLAFAIHTFFQERGFVYVNTPLITGSDCEGAGDMFRITTLDPATPPMTEDGKVDWTQDFFGKPTNLTVSGQLEGETFCMAFNKIYTFGPTFRAERSYTPRHAAEFWMVEPEIAFADLSDYMNLAEDMMKFIIKYVLEKCPDEMNFFNSFVDKTLLDRLNALVNAEFGRITYTEAVEILEKHNDSFDYKVEWGADIQTEHERFLTEKVFGKPVFVTDYPKAIKSFYMRQNEDGKTVAAADLLVPGVGEIIGGSQREERYDVLMDRIMELGLKPEDYSWYMDMRKYGSVKHAGYGLGFERALMYITGVTNIRDVLPFPRTTGSAEF